MLDKAVVKHIAKLSRLSLSESDEQNMQKDLSSILDYFAMLNEVNTDGVEPFRSPVVLQNVFKDDTPKTSACERETIINQFPQKDNNYLKVKEIF